MTPISHAAPRFPAWSGLLAPLALLRQHRRLILQLTRREIAGRYRGSRIGLYWSILNPLLLLTLYTFVFSTIFRMKWSATGHVGDFATMAFAGLLVHGLIAECLARAPGLILGNVSYVKKVVFPLDVLPWVVALSALFHTGINLLVLLGFVAWSHGSLPVTALLAPLTLLPLLLIALGASWFLASIGVFFRDIGQIIGFVITLLLFTSPIFYPLSAVPDEFRPLVELNFLTPVIEALRAVTIFGVLPELGTWGWLLAIGVVVAALGHYWFARSRHGFADVL